jgi:hypothetical protein
MQLSLSRCATLLSALAVLACGRDRAPAASSDTTAATPAATTAPAPPVVTITGTEFAFDAPAQIPAGLTTLRFVSNGKQLHHASLIRLDQGKTFDDFAAALKKPGPPPAWMVEVGGPNAPGPNGGVSEVTQFLAPGNYAIVCFVPGPDGVPHFAKGMMRALTVTPATTAPLPEPNADAMVTLADYSFTLSAPLTAGKHTLRVVNSGQQPHEIVIVRLEPGKTGEQVAAWVEGNMHGPPPGLPVGGVTALAVGDSSFLPIDLTAGNYAFLCFLPDAKDGKVHVMHGMVKNITIG